MDNELPALVKNLEEILWRGVAIAQPVARRSEFHMQPEPGDNHRPSVFVVPGMGCPL